MKAITSLLLFLTVAQGLGPSEARAFGRPWRRRTPVPVRTPTTRPTATVTPRPSATPTLRPTSTPAPLPTRTPTASPAATPTPSGSSRTVTKVYVTFYGYDDNDDGNGHYGVGVISDPVIHKVATEDLGTFARPSTFATDYNVAKRGQIIYVARLKKYYIMEDTCVECTRDWRNGKLRIDLYMGGNTALQGPPLIACEEAYTLSPYTDTVIYNPSPDLPVDTVPLFSNGVCHK